MNQATGQAPRLDPTSAHPLRTCLVLRIRLEHWVGVRPLDAPFGTREGVGGCHCIDAEATVINYLSNLAGRHEVQYVAMD